QLERRRRVDTRVPPRRPAARCGGHRHVCARASPRGCRGVSKRELFHRHPGNPILTAESWPYPANAVFNPAAAAVDGETVLLARGEDLRGSSHLTIARSSNGVDGCSIDTARLLSPAARVDSDHG